MNLNSHELILFMSIDQKRNAFKVCIFGDGGVGKTTLINRYVTGVFTQSTVMTIGVDFNVKKVVIEGLPVSLQIWDFAGEDRFRFLLSSYVKGASGGIFMFDITRFSSLDNINKWSEVIDECTDDGKRPLPIVLVGGKLDMEKNRAVNQEYGNELKKNSKLFIDYIECSSMTGQNVEDIFRILARKMLIKKGVLK
jgi:small GTP-binding protein